MERMSKGVLLVVAVLMLCAAALQGAQREFDDVVRAISDQLHARPLHIPFFGLVNFAAFAVHPDGVKHLNLAVFENVDLNDRAIRDLTETIQSAEGEWIPFVRVRDHAERVLVYMAQERGDCKLLVASIERNELTLVELKLNPEALQVWLREPEKSASTRRPGLE